MSSENDLKMLISKEEIRKKLSLLADQINKDYKDKRPLLIGILKGAFVFMADLIRELDIDFYIDFVKLSSYGSNTETSGEVKFVLGIDNGVKDEDVIIIEDIVDTGITLSNFIKYLKTKNPNSIKICTLTDKPSRREIDIPLHYVGFTIPNKFRVGYGIDFNEKYRNLPSIYYLEE
ncbi:MAG: hypoxanthine phosphoribosyltransferase [Promethearchaeota archaeon]|nr:MAG: hypoxanthine phosphoribosyltransferase [Candidatus Lokiarchaeota archaeon]